MAMRPHFAASLLGLSLMLSTGCGTTTTPPTATTQTNPQPQQTVAITQEEKPVEPAPAAKPEAPEPMKRPEMARITKDPFVNPFQAGKTNVVPSTGGTRANPQTQTVTTPTTTKGSPQNQSTAAETVEAPNFEVRGLVRSGSGMKALLAIADETRIVSNGQSVDGYQVASIDNRGVTVTRSGQKFRVKMKNEFGL